MNRAAHPAGRATNAEDDACRLPRLTAAAALLASLTACSIFPYERGTRANDPFAAQAAPTRGSERVSYRDLPDHKAYIGIALSGGGSRAANFAAASLLELERLGVPQNATAISSVSGGSLAAAYFGLYGNGRDPGRWNADEIKARLRRDLQSEWERRWLLPQNIVRFWFTPFDRSDIMKTVIDDEMFAGTTTPYRAMNDATRNASNLPRILINASNLTGQNFVFTDESFRDRLGSRLDTYPIAHAVMASAAFPGAFNKVTLEDYRDGPHRKYLHLLDGGPTDNLGIKALRRTLEQLGGDTATDPLTGCLFVVVDAFPDSLGVKPEQIAAKDKSDAADPRGALDFIFDADVFEAFDNLLVNHREEMLRNMGYPREQIGAQSLWSYRPFRDDARSPNRALECHVWHLTFQHLAQLGAGELGEKVNSIKTLFRLRADGERDPMLLQEELFEAARILVRQDAPTLAQVRRLLREWGVAQ